VEESFESRPLLDRDSLRTLQKRQNISSAIHLTIQLATFVLCLGLVFYASSFPLAALLAAILLGAVWATLFAPFHECTHQTAFRSRRLDAIGAWLTGIPFGMSPAVYREFHFAHHRFTHDPAKDPEIAGTPQLTNWPNTPRTWLYTISGLWLLRLKVRGIFRLALSSTTHAKLPPPFDDPELRSRFIWESRIVALVWTTLAVLALLGIRGAGWILFALIPCHAFQAIWLTTEHTGLPHDGTILTRTRTMHTSPFIGWWLWNMNYHAEHHAWPAVPWHALPLLHERIAGHLEHEGWGYWHLQLEVLHQSNLPNGARPLHAEQ
jgi:fatty acid desaturase